MTVDDQSPERLFSANLALIERVISRVCRDARLQPADADDFGSSVKLALIENDYAVLRAWQRRSSLATYLTIVVRRLLSDERSRTRGRWEPSAEARRIGKAGIAVETLVRRDGRSIEEALPHVAAIDPALRREDVEAMLARLPERVPRPRGVPLDEAEASARSVLDADAALVAAEVGRVSATANEVVRDTLAALPLQERMIVRLRFGMTMSIADISRMLDLPQRPLYRTVESVLSQLRRAFQDAGIDASTAGSVIESPLHSLDFGLGNGLANGKTEDPSRSSSHGDEKSTEAGS
ncbi:MAG TPA: sigma-70 family RNA polymerase sigma factor [Thermoanaerobaculia bacterium]